ncbi:hypothetical protein HK102_010802 [Quaeritorhiza haematococci]|nr:hypothetical protein HK102_010802 [Quaeritorhiza haematococci]
MKTAPDYSTTLRTINARDDSLLQGRSMWNGPKHSKRCIVLAQGFFEWLKQDKKKFGGVERQPYYMEREDGKLLMFAGLYDCAVLDGKPVYSYTIITTNSSESLRFLHDRMPVILNSKEDVELWLNPDVRFTDDVARLLKPLEEGLKMTPVSTFVSKVGNDSPDCIKPITLPSLTSKGSIANFFKKAPSSSSVSTSPPASPLVKSEDKDSNPNSSVSSAEVKAEDTQEHVAGKTPTTATDVESQPSNACSPSPTLKRKHDAEGFILHGAEALLSVPSPKKHAPLFFEDLDDESPDSYAHHDFRAVVVEGTSAAPIAPASSKSEPDSSTTSHQAVLPVKPQESTQTPLRKDIKPVENAGKKQITSSTSTAGKKKPSSASGKKSTGKSKGVRTPASSKITAFFKPVPKS